MTVNIKEYMLSILNLKIEYHVNMDDNLLTRVFNKYIEYFNINSTIPRLDIPAIYKTKMPTYSMDYKLTLKFLNSILKHVNKPYIVFINEFKKVNRSDIIKKSDEILDECYDDLLKYYNEDILLSNRKYDIDNYVMTLLKILANICGYTFIIDKRFAKNNTTSDTYPQSTDYYCII
jgi:hypothetical protein